VPATHHAAHGARTATAINAAAHHVLRAVEELK
jgi:hypothetical protein